MVIARRREDDDGGKSSASAGGFPGAGPGRSTRGATAISGAPSASTSASAGSPSALSKPAPTTTTLRRRKWLQGVDVDAATKHKIKVVGIPGSAAGNSTSCAEMAIYLILGLLRKQVGFNLLCYNRPLAIIGYKMFMRSIQTCCFTYCQPFYYFFVKCWARKD